MKNKVILPLPKIVCTNADAIWSKNPENIDIATKADQRGNNLNQFRPYNTYIIPYIKLSEDLWWWNWYQVNLVQ